MAEPTIVLVSTPWPLFNRPSIQLGALKAWLQGRFSGCRVVTHPVYLTVAHGIGYDLYAQLSERTWVSECVYSALLFPERTERIEALFHRQRRGKPLPGGRSFRWLTDRIRTISDAIINRADWDEVLLIGFSICLCQLSSALYFIRHIKQRCPRTPVVIGGSMVPAPTARGLMTAFPEIDFSISGEGERPLAELVRGLLDAASGGPVLHGPDILSRRGPEGPAGAGHQIDSIDDLPVPDFNDYFRLLEGFAPDRRFFPTLPVELSRGCWWRRPVAPGKEKGCAFCSLNLQWQGYRAKSTPRAVAEIETLTARHRLLTIAVADNLMPLANGAPVFRSLAADGRDYRLFGEIRADTRIEVLQTLRAAGMEEVQVGIEALSSRLLKKMNKGTTAIGNLQILKDCEEAGIAHRSNLILCFPGSDSQDVEETLLTLDFALPFRPLRPVRFWLGLGSPVAENFRGYGLSAVFNHRHYAALFPGGICRAVTFPILGYRGDLGRQQRQWKPVERRLAEWERHYRGIRTGPDAEPVLHWRDGKTFLIIRQHRLGKEPMNHRLEGTSRRIYLYCRRIRTLDQIRERYPDSA